MNNSLNTIIEEILSQAQVDSIDTKIKAEYKDHLRVLIEQRIGMLAFRELDKEGIEKLVEIMNNDKQDQNKMIDFLHENIEDLDNKIKNLVVEFAQGFIENTQPSSS